MIKKIDHRPVRGTSLTSLICGFLLMIIFAIIGSYVLFIFRETTTSKVIITLVSVGMITYCMSILRVGPFKNRR
jgi:hypothetical protein